MGGFMDVFTPASLSVLKRKLDLSKIKSLRARVFFQDFKQLQSSLEQIALIDQQKNFIKGLVQVVYQPEQIEYIYHELHFNFMKKCSKISSYVPLCSPIFDQNITKWATPTHCTSCIFFEGNRCEGLGNTENFIQNFKHIYENSTQIYHTQLYQSQEDVTTNHNLEELLFENQKLKPFQADLQYQVRNDFLYNDYQNHALMDLSEIKDRKINVQDFCAHRPIAYWMPQEEHLDAICRALIDQNVQNIWDIGASNGFLSHCIYQHPLIKPKQSNLSIKLIDPITGYSTPMGLERICMPIAQYMQSLSNPQVDAMIISWPPPLNGFQEIIDMLQPKVLIFAYDIQGFCGRQKGSYYAEWIDGLPYFFELTRFDFMSSYAKIDRFTVSCYRDLKDQRSEKTGVLEIHQKSIY